MSEMRGFTLVELLAVIIILSLLALLATTAVTKMVKDSKEDLYQNQILSIQQAAEVWGADNLSKLPDEGGCRIITLRQLKAYGLLDSSIVDPRTNEEIPDSTVVKISTIRGTYNNLLTTYEVNPSSYDECSLAVTATCKGVVRSAVAGYNTASKDTNDQYIGNVPTLLYKLGEEYICDVDGTNKYHFYILSTNDDNVNLILDRTIQDTGNLSIDSTNSTVSWSDRDEVVYGPISAFNFLSAATSNWINIPSMNMNYTYSDSTGGFSTEKFTVSIKLDSSTIIESYDDLKARLPYESELIAAGCTETGGCPLWISNYLDSSTVSGATSITGISGYWTIPTTLSSSIPIVDNTGSLVGSDYTISDSIGIRPVITVKKSNLIIPGDVNGDGLVNCDDYYDLKRYNLQDPSVSLDLEAADIDGDGSVSTKDSRLLGKILIESDCKFESNTE